MAGLKPAVALLLCVIAFALSCSTVSAADAAPAVKSVLKHPLGSGLNSPVSLNLTPKRGRRFLKLMQKLIDAARKGDLTIAQQIQQQLFAITGPKHHRRHLLQDVPAEVCHVLGLHISMLQLITCLLLATWQQHMCSRRIVDSHKYQGATFC
jgi:hypothetical protein